MIQATDILLLLVGGKIATNYLLYWVPVTFRSEVQNAIKPLHHCILRKKRYVYVQWNCLVSVCKLRGGIEVLPYRIGGTCMKNPVFLRGGGVMGKKEDLLICHPSPPPPINNERSLNANWVLHDHSVDVTFIKTKLQKTHGINQGFW